MSWQELFVASSSHHGRGTLDDQTTCPANEKAKGFISVFTPQTEHRPQIAHSTHMRSSTNRMFLFNPSIAFISASERQKSNIYSLEKRFILKLHFLFLQHTHLHDKHVGFLPDCWTNLKVLFNAGRAEALWDDHHSSLHIEPQGHLSCGFVVLFSNWYQ